MKNQGALSREDIRERIARGHAIVIYDSMVLKLDKWIPFHPGGNTAIYHMIGRDATDEMKAYHSDSTIETFKRYKIGTIDYKWENMLPPIQGGKYNTHFTDHPENYEEHNTEDSDETLTEEYCDKALAGVPDGKVEPLVPQEEIVTIDKTELYEEKVIRDPEDILANYDRQYVLKDLKMLPSLDYETQREISNKYNQLHRKVVAAGLYKCNYWNYFSEFCRIFCLLLWSAIFFKINHLFWSAFCLGWAWHQMTFIVHDAAHISITHNYQFDSWIAMTIASFIGGLSSTWWKDNHNVHHLITNDPVHDPDIQHLPFFAISTRLFTNVYSTYYKKILYYDAFAKVLIRIQNHMYYPILMFGRFNLYRLSWVHLILGVGPKKGKAAWFRYYELLGLVTFSYWFFYLLVYKNISPGWPRFEYIMVSHISAFLVHVQITLSHFAMSTSDLGVSESFPSRQLRTTMDVDCPEWFDFFHGGLQFQAIHHLFPRLPRHNLRKAQPYVMEFCEQTGLKYSIYGFVKGNNKVFTRFERIAQQAKIFADCTKSMKKEAKDEKNI